MVFAILLALGLGAAAGVRPFLPALITGVAGIANLRVDFDGTPFAFLEQAWWLIVVAVVMVVSYALIRRVPPERLDAAVGGLGIGVGVILAMGAVADRSDTWWYGALLGAAAATLAAVVARALAGRVRARFAASGDESAATTLPFYAEVAALGAALVTLLFPPLAVLVLAALTWLLVAGRRRGQQKYAGLRILR